MSRLVTSPSVAQPDEVYEKLIDLLSGRSDEESAIINARLIMLLINHTGDPEVIAEAIALAGTRNRDEDGD